LTRDQRRESFYHERGFYQQDQSQSDFRRDKYGTPSAVTGPGNARDSAAKARVGSDFEYFHAGAKNGGVGDRIISTSKLGGLHHRYDLAA
jgi:hypothetical protein